MPRTFKLTWQPGSSGRSGRWRKRYKRKVYYFDGGNGKSDRAAYNVALEAWVILKAKIDQATPRPHQVDYENTIQEWEKVFQWSNRHRDIRTAEEAYKKLETLKKRLEAPSLKPLRREDRFTSRFELPVIELPDNLTSAASRIALEQVQFGSSPKLTKERATEILQLLDGSPERIAGEVWADRLRSEEHRKISSNDTLYSYVEEYIQHKEQQYQTDELTSNRLYAIQLHLSYFRDWRGKDTAISEIDGKTLMQYKSRLLDEVKKKNWGRTTARHYLVTVKAFVRWLWQIEAIPSRPR
ncbi:Hypothetical protein PBC10988_3280 [Planctomycetales bacterium 10988]|nr:Hypothetical protein PBC10988_3280 [Planctomycetales bacterium 10988]